MTLGLQITRDNWALPRLIKAPLESEIIPSSLKV